MTPFQLHISEPDQIKILSAHLQDTIIRIQDILWIKNRQRFVLVGSRFCWEHAHQNFRTLCGFHFDDVLKASYRGEQFDDPNGFVHLLAICFQSQHAPSGIVRLIFSEENEIQLHVEANQAYLHDMGECWQAQRPQHSETI